MKLRNSSLPRDEHLSLVTSFVNHEFRKRGETLEGSDSVKGKEALKNVLAIVYGDTLGLTEPKNLTPAFER